MATGSKGVPRARTPLVDRFWPRVEVGSDDDCWLWLGTRDGKGYGVIGVGGRRSLGGKRAYAHRVSWELSRGAIPDGLFLCHHCDNPGCVNPSHLFLGTPRDNTADMISKGRNVVMRGEAHANSKLTAEKVREMRSLYAAGISNAECARRFGVCSATARDAILGIGWAHV